MSRKNTISLRVSSISLHVSIMLVFSNFCYSETFVKLKLLLYLLFHSLFRNVLFLEKNDLVYVQIKHVRKCSMHFYSSLVVVSEKMWREPISKTKSYWIWTVHLFFFAHISTKIISTRRIVQAQFLYVLILTSHNS